MGGTVVEPSQDYEQPPELFWNCSFDCARQFLLVDSDDDLAKPIVGRGAAYADIDDDGDPDVVLTQIGGPPRLLRNDQATGHNWIRIDVRDDSGAPAYGAIVDVVSGDLRQRRRVEPTRSYLSQVETTLSFGLGARDRVDEVRIAWPGGREILITVPAINRRHRVAPTIIAKQD